VFLGEPTPTSYDVHFQILGIPVRIHPLFWVAGALFAGGNRLSTILISIVALFLAIMVHEFGHALVMRYYGFSPRVVLYLMGGLAIPDSGGLWGGSRSRRMTPWSQILISAAGPLAGFLFAFFIIAAVKVFGSIEFVPGRFLPTWSIGLGNPQLRILVDLLLYVNIFWGIINLLPVYPLDGGQISHQLLLMMDPWNGIRKSFLASTVVAGVVAYGSYAYLGSLFMAMMFASLAASNYMAMQQTGGYGGGRPW